QFEFFLVQFLEQLVVFQLPQQFLGARDSNFLQQRSVFQLFLEQFQQFFFQFVVLQQFEFFFVEFFKQLLLVNQFFLLLVKFIEFFELQFLFQQQFQFSFLLFQCPGRGGMSMPLFL
ncbi:hypothetical protein, partial [Akkermansia sp.]